jgi:hypothetical protein
MSYLHVNGNYVHNSNSPFFVLAKVTKLIGSKNKGGLSPINLVTFAKNGE